ncbi:MAG: hypothetical protein OYH77_01980 [Pseudomonadota bacterium]|nr:hypothetical protein [Pseudomonadota bacterium]
MNTNKELPNHFQEYKKYVVERLKFYPLACHKTNRKLWCRQIRLAVAAGAKTETLFKLNPSYDKLKLKSQIRWFMGTHNGKPNNYAFLAFAKSIGAISFEEYIKQGGRGAAHDSS